MRLTLDDLEYMRAEVPFLKRVSPEVSKQAWLPTEHAARIISVRGAFRQLSEDPPRGSGRGELLRRAGDFNHSRVAVLGYDVKKKLFSGQDALGRHAFVSTAFPIRSLGF